MEFAPKPIPDKANHHNYTHVQSVEHAKHVDQPRECCKTQETAKTVAGKKGNAEHADDQRENEYIYIYRKIRQGGFVRDGSC